MTRATVCFESRRILLQISLIRVHNQRPFDSGSDEGGQRDICVLSGTWFRNMLEWIGAAFTITQPRGNTTGIKGYERAEAVMGQCAGSTVARILCTDGAARAACRARGLLPWAALFGPTNPHLHTQGLSTAPWAQGLQHCAVPPPFWCQGTWLCSKLVLGQAAGQQLDEMFSTCTVSLLRAAVTKELPLLALRQLCLPARRTLLPQHSLLTNARGAMWMEVSSSHTFPQNTQLFWGEVSPTILLVLALKKREGLQWAHSRWTVAILHPSRRVGKHLRTHRNIKWIYADWGSGPYIL